MNINSVGVTKVPVINLTATGRNITKLRKNAGISVRDLQKVMGFTNPQAIYKWQNGCSLPTIDNLIILASVLDTTIDEILVCDEDPAEDIQRHFIHEMILTAGGRYKAFSVKC